MPRIAPSAEVVVLECAHRIESDGLLCFGCFDNFLLALRTDRANAANLLAGGLFAAHRLLNFCEPADARHSF